MPKGKSIAIVNQGKADMEYLSELEKSIIHGEADEMKMKECKRMRDLVNARYTDYQQAGIFRDRIEQWVIIANDYDEIHYVWPTKQELQSWKNGERTECTQSSYRYQWYEDIVIFET